MKRCKSCKHFSYEKYSKSTPDYVGRCSCEAFTYLGYGDQPKNGEFEYWAFESYEADFRVTELFGCIHHKERNNK